MFLIDCTDPLYLCELIEQQNTYFNKSRLADDAFLLKLPPPSRNCDDTFCAFLSLWGTIWMEQAR